MERFGLTAILITVSLLMGINAPDWYLNPPKDDEGKVIFVKATGEAAFENESDDIAEENARVKISSIIKSTVERNAEKIFDQKRLKTTSKINQIAIQEFNNSTSSSTKDVIKGARTYKSYTIPPEENDGFNYKTYLVMAYLKPDVASIFAKAYNSAVTKSPSIKETFKPEVLKSIESKEISTEDWIKNNFKEYDTVEK